MEDIKCEALGAYISQINRKSNVFITKRLSEYGIGSGQYMFLLRLYKQDGIIYRVKDEMDKRAYSIYLTDKAKNIRLEVFEILKEWEKIITFNLSIEEKDGIMNILKKYQGMII